MSKDNFDKICDDNAYISIDETVKIIMDMTPSNQPECLLPTQVNPSETSYD